MRKRLLAMGAVMVLMFALLLSTLSVSAAEPVEKISSLVVFGDSISTGYGLEGTLYTRSSYSNLVAQKLGLSQGDGYVNHAVDGYTSEDILKKAIANEKDVAGADLILLTNGGNDVLSKMLMIAMQAAGITSLDLMQAAAALASMPAEEINAKLYSDANNATIAAALSDYRQNLTELVTFLKTTAPEARVVFLTQYNPLSGVIAFQVLDDYSEDIIGQLNTIMTEVVTAGGLELVDTHSVMVGRGMILSNIMSADIHPNAAGHTMISQKVIEYLGLNEQESTTTSTTTVTTTTTQPVVTTTEPIVTTTTETTTVTEPITETTATAVSETTTEPDVTTSQEETEPVGADPSDPGDDGKNGNGGTMALLLTGAVILTVGIVLVIVAMAGRKKA